MIIGRWRFIVDLMIYPGLTLQHMLLQTTSQMPNPHSYAPMPHQSRLIGCTRNVELRIIHVIM